MMFGLSSVEVIAASGVVGVLLLLGSVASRSNFAAADLATAENTVSVDELKDDPEQVVTLPEPDLRKSPFGFLGQYIAFKRYKRKQRKLAKKGYVRWFLVDGTFSRPKFVRPEHKQGGDVPELDYNGGTYLFPKEAAVPDEKTGMWTVVHLRDQADPVNLRDPSKTAISAKSLDEFLGMRVSSSAPSLLDKINTDPQTILAGAIGLVIVYAVVMGGI